MVLGDTCARTDVTNAIALFLALLVVAAIAADLAFDAGLLLAAGRRMADLVSAVAFWR